MFWSPGDKEGPWTDKVGQWQTEQLEAVLLWRGAKTDVLGSQKATEWNIVAEESGKGHHHQRRSLGLWVQELCQVVQS